MAHSPVKNISSTVPYDDLQSWSYIKWSRKLRSRISQQRVLQEATGVLFDGLHDYNIHQTNIFQLLVLSPDESERAKKIYNLLAL